MSIKFINIMMFCMCHTLSYRNEFHQKHLTSRNQLQSTVIICTTSCLIYTFLEIKCQKQKYDTSTANSYVKLESLPCGNDKPYSSHVKILLIIIYHYSALYQKLYIQSKSAPEDGRICRPKHVWLI